jgi:hypothetical protein
MVVDIHEDAQDSGSTFCWNMGLRWLSISMKMPKILGQLFAGTWDKNEGCLKGIPPSTYLRIIKYYSGRT